MQTTVASTLVVGAGVSGLRSALDLALLGHKVVLIERAPFVGGTLIQLDRQFPNDYCGICRMLPMVERDASSQFCLRRGLLQENIDIRLSAELLAVTGKPGHYQATLHQQPAHVDPGRCIGCGECSRVCPVEVPDGFNSGMTTRKAIYLPVPYSLPNGYVVDNTACTRCGECEKVCPTRAIDIAASGSDSRVDVDTIILTTGFASYQPELEAIPYCFDLPNVVTSMEFERMVSAAGPAAGQLLRPSDGQPIRKVAWFHCIGSRNIQLNADFCSSACCMYSIKEALLAKSCGRDDVETVLFYMDMRTFGKGFQRYRDRAENQSKIRFVRSRIHSVVPQGSDGQLMVTYMNSAGELEKDTFDLIVLATGQRPAAGNEALAVMTGTKLNHWGFCQPQRFSTCRTDREGIYTGGALLGLQDISESVIQASAAAMAAANFIRGRQGRSATELEPLPEFGAASPVGTKVDIVICACDGVFSLAADLREIIAKLHVLETVGSVHIFEHICARKEWQSVEEVLRGGGGNRLLICACKPHIDKEKINELGRNTGINPDLIEVMDIRFLLLPENRPGSSAFNNRIYAEIAAEVGRLNMAIPTAPPSFSIDQRALVVGGGIAGMTAALAIADHGYPVDLVEQTPELGGNLRGRHRTLEGHSPQALLSDRITRLRQHGLVQVRTGSRLVESRGHLGHFISAIETGDKSKKTIRHGITILATGGQEARPTAYHYGDSPRVCTQGELETALHEGRIDPADLQNVAMIQCVGLREEPRNYCSRICCASALKNALFLKELNPDVGVYIFYRDMMSYGFSETYYTRARDAGIIFIGYEVDHKPEVALEDGRPQVTARDPVIGRKVTIDADVLVLSSGMVPSDNIDLAQLLDLQLDIDGFFQEMDPKWRPVDTSLRGVFICGVAHSPRSITESIAMAEGAAQRAVRFLSKAQMSVGSTVASVDERLCTGCRTCEGLCPYDAVDFSDDSKTAHVNAVLCQGCGACAAACPTSAIGVSRYTADEIYAHIEGKLT